MAYVDGFLLVVPKKNIADYKKMAKIGARMWKKYGAVDYQECVGDDLKSSFGKSFARQMKTRPGETVVFSYIVYKSKAHRNAVNKKVMADPAMTESMKDIKMPFDVKRMCYGGFKVLVGW